MVDIKEIVVVLIFASIVKLYANPYMSFQISNKFIIIN